MRLPATKAKLGPPEGSISGTARPVLPAVVIRADKQMPSGGLFKFAKKHGLMKDNDQAGFFSVELRRVYEAWRT